MKKKQANVDDESMNGLGLCMNCDDISICNIRITGQPVIYCEEYRVSCRDEEKNTRENHSFNAPIDFGIKL